MTTSVKPRSIKAWREDAATKIQAAFRGNQIRVMKDPSQARSSVSSTATQGTTGYQVGSRIFLQLHGVIKFAGATEFSGGQWLGLELDESIGVGGGVEPYFKCKDGCGLMLQQPVLKSESQSRSSLKSVESGVLNLDDTASLKVAGPTGQPVSLKELISGNLAGQLVESELRAELARVKAELAEVRLAAQNGAPLPAEGEATEVETIQDRLKAIMAADKKKIIEEGSAAGGRRGSQENAAQVIQAMYRGYAIRLSLKEGALDGAGLRGPTRVARGPPRGAARCGWLLVRDLNKEWQPRFCVLMFRKVGLATLESFTDERCATLTNQIKIIGDNTVKFFGSPGELGDSEEYRESHPHGFVFQNTNKELYYFDAEDPHSLNVWARAIQVITNNLPQVGAAQLKLGNSAAKTTDTGAGLPPVVANLETSGDMDTPLTLVILGATGDLARKKLYPALYQLMFGAPDAPLIPQNANVVGYGRSQVDLKAFLDKQTVNIKGDKKDQFLARCSFFAGAYDKEESYAGLHEFLQKIEGGGKANRIFFYSVPPTIFASVCAGIKAQAMAPGGGFTRNIIEKPFGSDSDSYADLAKVTSASFPEDELYRIDHYLGKEVVLNLTTLRFGNQLFEGIWNREHIQSVQIVFKEDLGTGGRGGYFDGFGIIRDIMQNHLLQVLLWLAMEPPSALDRESVAVEKVKLLKAMKTIKMEDCFLGQFGKNAWMHKGERHEEPGYLDDPTVPPGSTCPTYAAVSLEIDNDRWRGVPFMMRAGKGLDERMAEVRITFKTKAFNSLVPGGANELVMRIQPEEAIYLKCMNKMPGWHQDISVPIVLDMTYSSAFPGNYVADAYERMFLNTFKGDGSLFVGSDELTEAWRVFTPLLKEIDEKKPQPVIYPFGVNFPKGMRDFMKKRGMVAQGNWEEYLALHNSQFSGLMDLFNQLDSSGDGYLDEAELQAFVRRFVDGRDPSPKQLAKLMDRIDLDRDGKLTLQEVLKYLAFSASMS